MLIFQIKGETKVKSATDEVPAGVLRLLESYKGQEKTAFLNQQLIENHKALMSVANGIDNLNKYLQAICQDDAGKFPQSTKSTAAFFLGIGVAPTYEMDAGGRRVLSDEFREELANMVKNDPDLAKLILQAADAAENYRKYGEAPPSVVLKFESERILNNQKPDLLGVPSNTGYGFVSKEFYRDLYPRVLQSIPLGVSIPSQVDVSYLTPGGNEFVQNIFNPLQKYAGKTMSSDTYTQEFLPILGVGVDTWLSASYRNPNTNALITAGQQIASDLKAGSTLAQFTSLMKMGNMQEAMALLTPGSISATSFGLGEYKNSTAFISGEKMGDLVDHALTYGAVVTKNLDRKGRHGISLYIDHGVLTLAGNTGKDDINYSLAGVRMLVNLPEIDVKAGGGVAVVKISGSGNTIDALRFDLGGNWTALNASDLFKLVFTGKGETVSYFTGKGSKPDSFTDFGLGTRLEGKIPIKKAVDIELSGGLFYSARDNPRVFAGLGLTNVVIGPGAASLYFDVSAPLGQRKQTFDVPKMPYSAAMRLTYRF